MTCSIFLQGDEHHLHSFTGLSAVTGAGRPGRQVHSLSTVCHGRTNNTSVRTHAGHERQMCRGSGAFIRMAMDWFEASRRIKHQQQMREDGQAPGLGSGNIEDSSTLVCQSDAAARAHRLAWSSHHLIEGFLADCLCSRQDRLMHRVTNHGE